MARRSLGLTLTVAVLALMAGAAFAQGDCLRDSLKAHNEYRAQHGALPLEWDDALAARERVWVTKLAQNGCQLQHSPGNLENLYAAWGTGLRQDSCRAAADSWYSEVQYYKFGGRTPYTTSMAQLPRNVRPPAQIGHFTQMIWRSATKVGCFTATGPNGCVVVGCAYDDGNSPQDSVQLNNVMPKGTPMPDARPAVSTADEQSFCPSLAQQGGCLEGTTLGNTGRLIAAVCPASCKPILDEQRQKWLDESDAMGPIDPPNKPLDDNTPTPAPGDAPVDTPTPSPSPSPASNLVVRKQERYVRGPTYAWVEGDDWNLDAAKARCEKDNGAGKCEQVGMEMVPKCDDGFVPFGCCFCNPDPFANSVAARKARFF